MGSLSRQVAAIGLLAALIPACLFAVGAQKAAPAEDGGRFAREPAIRKADGGYEISFVLTAPNDVTVRIVDAKGGVLRHLASLGRKG